MMEDLQDHNENLLIDRETLESHIKGIITADPEAPDLLAHLLVKLKRAVENGIRQASQINETLQVAIELAYLHTEAHSAALRLYTLYQQGELLVQDFPLALINAAIDRSRVGEEFESETNNQPNEKTDSKE
jgi:hypothetical protein